MFGNPKRCGSKSPIKPYTPAHGTEFDLEDAPIIEARTRGFIAKGVMTLTASAIFVTGGYGLLIHDFGAVQSVWNVAGPITGAIVTYYFGPRKDSG